MPDLELERDRLMSVATLAAGGAIIAVSLAGVVSGVLGHKSSDVVDAIAALLGAFASAAFMFSKFPIFGHRDRPSESKNLKQDA